MGIKYVFWDSDNTLVGTATHHWNKHAQTLKKQGITLDDKYQGRIYTNNGSQNWDWLSAELGLALPRDQYLDEIDSWYYAHIGDIAVRPGIEAALDLCDSLGIPMGVVSNGRKRSVMSALDAKRLSLRFKFILCIEDYQGRKPDAAPYLAAKTKMQQIIGAPINAADCLVVEDDPKGVEAGKAAGMSVLHRPVGAMDEKEFIKKLKEYLLV